MLVTEKTAASKWCPFARGAVGFDGGRVAVNRIGETGALPIGHCIGSQCMAWKWFNDTPHPDSRVGLCGLTDRTLE